MSVKSSRREYLCGPYSIEEWCDQVLGIESTLEHLKLTSPHLEVTYETFINNSKFFISLVVYEQR